MISANTNRCVDFKTIDINLSKIIYDVINSNYADLIEIFRLEAMLPPAIMANPIDSFQDSNFNKIYTIWDRLANHGFETKLPLLSQLPISTLRMMGYAKISFYNMDTQDYDYIHYDDYVHHGTIHFTTTIKEQMYKSNSANAIFYYVINAVTLLKSQVMYTIHHTKNTDNTGFQSWYSMHIPFLGNHQEALYPQGVISFLRKI